MIHPPDVIGKYAPDAFIGMIGTGGGGCGDGDLRNGSLPVRVSCLRSHTAYAANLYEDL
jgi:hypothetical protein